MPYDGFNDKNLLTPIRLNSLSNRITLVKTGPVAPGLHSLDGRELFSGHPLALIKDRPGRDDYRGTRNRIARFQHAAGCTAVGLLDL
ncbi:hypothetical protein D3C71_1961530 [compost metagenome]